MVARGGGLNRTNSTSPPPLTTLPTHGAFSDYGKRITTTPLCLLVSLIGEAGKHHPPPPPSVISLVLVLMPFRGCVFSSIPPPPTPASKLTPISRGQACCLGLVQRLVPHSYVKIDSEDCGRTFLNPKTRFLFLDHVFSLIHVQ